MSPALSCTACRRSLEGAGEGSGLFGWRIDRRKAIQILIGACPPERAGSFYPSAFSMGCGLEAHTFAQEKEKFDAAGATIITKVNASSADPNYCVGKSPRRF
jgi:hypothetical protein